MKSSDYIVQFLAEHGIRHAYGYQGTMIAHFADSLGQSRLIKNHVCRSEQGAAFAAVGEAKITGKPALAYSTSGPGAANLLNGVADAYFDSAPVIFITGQLNTYEYLDLPGIRQHGFQQMDVVSIMRPITKYCVKVEREDDLRYVLERAFYTAVHGRPGPVVIDLPMNMQRMDVDPQQMRGFTPSEATGEQPDRTGAAAAIVTAAERAEQPVLVLGSGLTRTDREITRKAVDKLGIPVLTSLPGRDILPADHPLNFGFIGAAYGHRYANLIINKKADLIVALGCSLCRRQTGMKTESFAAEADIIRVDTDPVELQRKVHADETAFLTDCRSVVRELLNRPEHDLADRRWIDKCRTIKERLEALDAADPERAPNRTVELISRYTQDAAVVCCDVGQHQVWGAQSYRLGEGQRMLSSGGHGCMGFSLPAAIGAQAASGCPVITLTGDGSLQMNIQELEWIRHERLPITLFVLNNSTLGLIHQQQNALFDGRYIASTDAGGYSHPDFTAVAAAYGIHARAAADDAELEAILQELDLSIPNLIDIKLSEDSNAFPKTCFGEPMHNQQPYMPKELMEELLAL
ncbi:MAG: thiamine pyrophosphate-binding protein [Anaerovoracaceae bacterium]|jgi:acetolactate synthase-1/2/3 large subunit